MGRPRILKEGDEEYVAPIVENLVDKGVAPTTDDKPLVVGKKDEIVEIKKTDFEKLMKRMDSQAKNIDLLLKTADKSRMARELNKEGENLIKQAKVRTWDDTKKIVIGWKLITNKCEVVMGRWVEEQTTTLILEGGEVVTVPLIEFYRKTLTKIDGDIIARTEELDENNNKSMIFKLQFPNGKILLINSAFVN